MAKCIGKVVKVWTTSVSLNVGKAKLLSVPIRAFKHVPDEQDKVELSHDGFTVKQYKGEEGPVLSKTLSARNLKVLGIIKDYEEVDYVEEAEEVEDNPFDDE